MPNLIHSALYLCGRGVKSWQTALIIKICYKYIEQKFNNFSAYLKLIEVLVYKKEQRLKMWEKSQIKSNLVVTAEINQEIECCVNKFIHVQMIYMQKKGYIYFRYFNIKQLLYYTSAL